MTLTGALQKIQLRVWDRQLPKVITVSELAPSGVRFEAGTPSELRRIVSLGWEGEYLKKMCDALDTSDVLYDVGANIGLVALHGAQICQTVAFEPDPQICRRLRRNCELNPDVSVDVREVAVANTDGTMTLFSDGADGTSPSLVHQRSERGTLGVASRTLDSLVGDPDLLMPTVLKMDIEGAEILALRGGSALLQSRSAPRLLLLEVHDKFLPGFGSSADEVLALVREAGYCNVMYEAVRSSERHLMLGRG